MKNIWFCKIGGVEVGSLPGGSDLPMRLAVEEAYRKITGQEPEFTFSGWGGELNLYEWAVVLDCHPADVVIEVSKGK